MSKIAYDLTLIRGIVFDVDGVLSPSTIPLGLDGMPQRMVNVKDGFALQLAVKTHLHIAIITGADSPAVALRYGALGIADVYQNVAHKLPCLKKWMNAHELTKEQVAYVGDDIPDLLCLQHVGLSAAPCDADPFVRQNVKYISPFKGGMGVARDLLQQIMIAQGLWLSDEKAFGW